ncbi:MAG: hypothetical protein NTY77_02705 [Elusimicrobia bacterium]|nr:hypothetical protein [Elusimicrobiota bacterium]
MATLEIAAAVFFCLLFQTAGAGERQGSQAQPAAIQQSAGVRQAQKAATRTKLFGTVRSVDAENRKLVVRTETGKTRRFALSAGTQLDKGSNHKGITLADFKSGDPISIIMEGRKVRAIHVFLAPK